VECCVAFSEQFCQWLAPILERLSDKGLVPAPEQRLMVISIRDAAWERIPDEKNPCATETAYFPKEMKLSDLDDMANSIAFGKASRRETGVS